MHGESRDDGKLAIVFDWDESDHVMAALAEFKNQDPSMTIALLYGAGGQARLDYANRCAKDAMARRPDLFPQSPRDPRNQPETPTP